ncbi:hypothetical protein Gpo141_00003004 [Globisporangium polare]
MAFRQDAVHDGRRFLDCCHRRLPSIWLRRAATKAHVEDIFITDGGPVRVGVCTGSTPRPWQEDVLRSREALELLALITAVENVTTLPLLPPPPTRRLLVSSSSRDIPADVPDVEVFQAFFLAFDECILRAELRDAIQQVFNQVPPAKRDELASTLESLVLKQDGSFRVMRSDATRDWVDIIVPHYGYCIVPRISVDHFALDSSTTSSSAVFGGYSDSITSLKVTDSNHKALLPLIGYIDPKLLSLSVGGNVDPLFLRHALAACPNLTSVEVVEPPRTRCL